MKKILFLSLMFLVCLSYISKAKEKKIFIDCNNGKKISVESVIGKNFGEYTMPWELYIPNTYKDAMIFNRSYYNYGNPTIFGLNSFFGGCNYKAIGILKMVLGCSPSCAVIYFSEKTIKKLPKKVSQQLLGYIVDHEKLVKSKLKGGEALWRAVFDYVAARDNAGSGRYENHQNRSAGAEANSSIR